MACANADTPSHLLSQSAAEEAVLCLVNEERANAGVHALTLNRKLRTAARQQAEAAATLKWWAGGGPAVHVNPVTGSTPKSRIHDAGYCPIDPNAPTNENAYDAYYQGGLAFQANTSPRAAVKWWMNSAPHRATLLNSTYNESGVAVVQGIAEQGPEADLADGGSIFVQTFGFCEKPEPLVPMEVWAWGIQDIGDGTGLERDTPVQLQGLSGVIAIASSAHRLAIKEDGTLWAWGTNDDGQLGDGTTTERITPIQVRGIDHATAVAAGADHSLALRSDGTVWSWGRNRYGQLGDGTNTDRHTPIMVPHLAGVTHIAAGEGHSLALKSDGSVWAWGANSQGQLGIGSVADHVDAPVKVNASTVGGRFIAIAAGKWFSLAIAQDTGHAWAWGYNPEGQLGIGTIGDIQSQLLPTRVLGLDGLIAIAADTFHSLALKKDGTVWAWGTNDHGLGDGSTKSGSPVQVRSLSGVADIAAGVFYSMALKKDGTVWTWGLNFYGELGFGTTGIGQPTPVRAVGLMGATAIAAGWHRSLAAAPASGGG